MGWRKIMRVETADINSNPKSNNSNMSNIQENNPVKPNIADIADIALKVQKIKTPQQQFDSLWKKAWALADWIDDSSSTIPWQKRTAKVPKLQEMSAEIDRLKNLLLSKDCTTEVKIIDKLIGDKK